MLMDGTAAARRIVEKATADAAALTAEGVVPCLATVLVGADPASVTYVRMKQNRSAKAGIGSWHVELPENITTATLVPVLPGINRLVAGAGSKAWH